MVTIIASVNLALFLLAASDILWRLSLTSEWRRGRLCSYEITLAGFRTKREQNALGVSMPLISSCSHIYYYFPRSK